MKTSIYILLTSLITISCSGEQGNNENQSSDSTTVKITEKAITTGPKRVEFPSADGLIVSGYLHAIDDTSTVILLCHQSGFNFHEYDEIAPRLNELGFNCLAIDQRAGGIMDGVVNETADRALDLDLSMDYIAAEQDIIAAIDFVSERFNQPIILWGSSYSAGLALHIGETNSEVKAVIAFSPGNYFGDEKPDLVITLKDFSKPFFITSSKRESKDIDKMLKNKPLDSLQIQFIPETEGKHGSKALWSSQPGNGVYWTALEEFLERII